MRKLIVFVLLIGAIVFGALFAVSSVRAQDETGNVCVQDYVSGASCTANDVRIEELNPIEVVEACNEGTVGEVEVIFEALVSANGSPDRWDIGLFIDRSGTPGGALVGDNCLHTYLEPPVTANPTYGDYNSDTIPDIKDGPWWDGGRDADMCGDIESDTQVIKTIQVRLACVDNSGDPLGAADVHVCSSWDNNTSTACTDVSGAVPGTGSKCSCTTFEFGFTPTALEMFGMTGTDETTTPSLWLAGTALVLLLGASLIVLRRRRTA